MLEADLQRGEGAVEPKIGLVVVIFRIHPQEAIAHGDAHVFHRVDIQAGFGIKDASQSPQGGKGGVKVRRGRSKSVTPGL